MIEPSPTALPAEDERRIRRFARIESPGQAGPLRIETGIGRDFPS